MTDGKPIEIIDPARVQKCGFSRLSPLTGNCKECGDPADPTTKGYCTYHAISRGLQPFKPGTQVDDTEPNQK
ncbi:MAG TPA: hypothetical protein V6C81_02550 [Planktothrix sp.]|jgi:hypothetical protein